MKKIFTLFLLLSAFVFTARSAHLQPHMLFGAKLDGAQEVPAVSTTAVGIGSFTLNAAHDTMFVNVTVTGLSGAITGAHVHDGNPGTSGPIVTSLMAMVNGNVIRGIITGSDLSTTNIAKYLKGAYYINVHTAQNPNGEIRGQILLETDMGFTAKLNGAQEVPAVTTSAYGLGTFNLSHDKKKLKFMTVVQGLSGPITAAHFHQAPTGQSGGVIQDLQTFINGNIISGEVDPTAYIQALMTGGLYINVHTAQNPNGEIRGQIVLMPYLMFDAMFDGSQEVPAVTTNARAVASVMLSPTMDTLKYDIVANGMSGAITGAHFHDGPAGTSGMIVVDLTSSINGNRIQGMVTGSALTTAFINKMISGGHYLNLHTAQNPNGEIRGQVYRLMREGFTIGMNGTQENPAVATTANGAGFVSIDRDQSNAHFMMAWDGLSGPPSMAHFHKAVSGQNGAVIFNLTPFFDNTTNARTAAGYWNMNSSPAFATANSAQFRSDSMYVNVHTAQNPNGEIRGQVVRGANSLARVLSTKNLLDFVNSSLSFYPNPVNSEAFITWDATRSQDTEIVVQDVLGKVILKQKAAANTGSNSQKVNLENLPAGMYIVKLSTHNQITSLTFIKN